MVSAAENERSGIEFPWRMCWLWLLSGGGV